MGGSFGKNKKSSKVTVVGLDNSGKSTIINHLKPEKKKVKSTTKHTTGRQTAEQQGMI